MVIDTKVKNTFPVIPAGNELLSGSPLTTCWCYLGLDVSLFELKISITSFPYQERSAAGRNDVTEAPPSTVSEAEEEEKQPYDIAQKSAHILCYFSAYQKLKNSSEMAAWILSEHKLMGSILSQ